MKKIFFLVLTFSFIFCGQSFAVKKAKQITATSWLVADGNGKIIKSVNHDEVHSIASITKLMTAMVVLDANQNLDEKIGKFTRRQHLQLALIKSNNRSADILCENYPGGSEACIAAMNSKAKRLKMTDTQFVDASGLNEENVSTAKNLIRMVLAAKNYPLIVKASQTSMVKIKLKNSWFSFRNTNPLIGQQHKFIVSKTGYIKAAGGCIALMLDTNIGQKVVIVLGSRSTHTRIPEAVFIAKAYK